MLQRSPWCRKAKQSFPAETALAPLTETVVIALTNLETVRYITQLMKVRKLCVRDRTNRLHTSPPSSPVTGTWAAAV